MKSTIFPLLLFVSKSTSYAQYIRGAADIMTAPALSKEKHNDESRTLNTRIIGGESVSGEDSSYAVSLNDGNRSHF